MSKKSNILLIAYYFSPDKRVGALRATYWFQNLPSQMNCNVEVLTANPDTKTDQVHYVPTNQKPKISRFIKDEGLLWKENLKSFLNEERGFIPDTVIITGGPFMHFGITSWLKEKFDCNVILDYRDPFANNPGFQNKRPIIAVKKFFEKRFNKQADALITVNRYCSELIEDFDKKRNAIIQNGFDEKVEIDLKKPDLSDKLNLIYTGKFYFDPIHLCKAVHNHSSVLNYYGADGAQLSNCDKEVKDYGLVTYKESIRAIAKSDVGVVQTYGEDFQSTTKLFDYIRCKKPILIISDKHMNRGSIHDELKGYPNVFWSENNQLEIEKTLVKIKEHRYTEPDEEFVNKYSRGRQMEKLVELIKELSANG
ncbi:glycosyltransferase family protein [Halocola ammonii]